MVKFALQSIQVDLSLLADKKSFIFFLRAILDRNEVLVKIFQWQFAQQTTHQLVC